MILTPDDSDNDLFKLSWHCLNGSSCHPSFPSCLLMEIFLDLKGL